MNDNLQPLPDEHLEARITAWVLGQASPFEAAELEALCAADPELQLFLNRTKALHSLLLETPPSTSDQFWKLSPENREKLDPIIGSNNSTAPTKDSSIRRAAYRTAFGIAAVLAITVFIKRFIVISPQLMEKAPTMVTYESTSDEVRFSRKAQDEVFFEKTSLESKSKNLSSSQSGKSSTPSASAPAPARERESSIAMADSDFKNDISDRARGVSNKPAGMAAGSRMKTQELDMAITSPPTSAMSKAIAAAEPNIIPAPNVNPSEPSVNFGDGRDFGKGWGSAKGETSDAFASNDGQNKGGFAYESGTGKKASLESDESLRYEGKFAETEKGTETDPFTAAAGEQRISGVPGSAQDTVAGLRSGDYAIARESVDAILNNSNHKPDDEVTILPATEGEGETPVSGSSFRNGTLAHREIARRQNNITEADRNLVEGREAYAKGDYSEAADKYKEALAALPDTPAQADRREAYSQHLGDASVAQAQQMRKAGKYDEARELLEQAETLSPTDAKIKNELGYLNDPIRTNPALTYKHTDKIDDVRRNLYLAQGNYDLGKYDDAKKAYEDTLRIDPYNSAARRGMEKIANTKSDYYRAAYDQTRSELLMQVDKAWELSLPADAAPTNDLFAAAAQAGKDQSYSELDLYDKKETHDLATNGYFKDLSPLLDTGLVDHQKNNLAPAEFEGFVNHGSPINQSSPQWTGAWDSLAGEGFKQNLRAGSERSDVTITREFQYPTEYDLPEVPSSTFFLDTASESWNPLTPATPSVLEESSEGELAILGDIPVIGKLFKNKPFDLSTELSASEESFSTFSLNISDASFQLALAAIEKGERPDPASIKPEQFYNAVDYGDPAPSTSEPVAAAIDQTAHPVIPGRNLVRVALRTGSTGRSAAQPLRLTLLVDQSGSMVRADRRVAMESALAQLATLLTEHDQVTVIGFSRTPHLLAQSLPGNQAAKLPELINQTASEGGTNLEQAINLATEQAISHQLAGAQNRIVLFTDGAANLGDADPDRLSKKIQDLRQQGLAFDIAGIGTNDLNDRLLSDLARHGNGRYYLVGEKTGGNLAAQLAGAFRPAAENVKVQVKLNPQRVGNYKLIGFEKDRLKTEDFRNDAVDAAELAADEAGVALYQVETLPEGTGEIGEVSVRFRDTASGEMVERTWTIPYDASAPSFDKANPKTQLATLAVLAAQKLQTGPLADAINFSNYSETIAQLKQANANSAKTQQLLNLINALK